MLMGAMGVRAEQGAAALVRRRRDNRSAQGVRKQQEQRSLKEAFGAALSAGELNECARVQRSAHDRPGGGDRAYDELCKLHRPFLQACATSGRLQLAFEHAWAFPPSRQPYLTSMLIAACGASSLYTSARSAFDLHLANGFAVNEFLLSGLISAAGKASRLADAHSEFESAVDQFPLATALYNAYMDAAVRNRSFEEVKHTFRRMRSAGSPANVQTYNTLINAAAKQNDLKAALASEQALLADGHNPTDRTFGSLISCAAACRDAGTAVKIFERMRRSGCSPNNHAASAVLTAIGRAADESVTGDVRLPKGYAMKVARAVVRRLIQSSCEPNEAVWTALASVAAATQRPTQAVGVIKWMKERGHQLDAWTLSAALGACHTSLPSGSSKQMTAVERLLAEFYAAPAEARTSEATNSAMKLLVVHSRHDAATALLHSMEQKNELTPTLLSYQMHIDGLVELDQPAEALRVFRRLRRRSIVPDDHICSSIIKVIGKRRTPQAATQAESALERMLGCGAKVGSKAYAELIRAKALSGSMTHANGAFDTLQHMCRSGFMPSRACFNNLLEACAALGDASAASSVLASMHERGLEPSELSNNMIVSAMARSGNLEEMLRHLIRTAKSGYVHSSTMEATLSAFLDAQYAQRAARAVSLAETMQLHVGGNLYSKVLSALSREGSLLEAEEMYEKALTRGVELRLSAISNLVEARASAGHAKDALKLANQRGVPELNDRAIMRLATACARDGNLEAALSAFDTFCTSERLENLQARPLLKRASEMFDAVIQVCLEQNCVAQALDAFDQSKRNPRLMVGQHALAYLYARSSYIRRLDIAAAMRSAQESAREIERPSPRKYCHHVSK